MKQIKHIKEIVLKYNFFKIGLFVMLISLSSCDNVTGMDGTVIDNETGEELEGVKVEMISYYKTINTTTDKHGKFYTSYEYTCGIIKCDRRFTITFEKEGYEKLELNQDSRANSDHDKFIDKNNTVRLTKLEGE